MSANHAPTRGEQFELADRAPSALGLEGHLAVVVAHNDTKWTALLAAGRAVEPVVVNRDPVRVAATERVLDQCPATPPESVRMSQQEAAAGLAAIKNPIATSDWSALEVYGGLRPAIQRACVLDVAGADSRRSRAAITSGRVPATAPASLRLLVDHLGPSVVL